VTEHTNSDRISRLRSLVKPQLFFLVALTALLLSWLGFYLVDLRNIFGLRDIVINLDSEYFSFTPKPFLFDHLFRNGGPVEMLQWLFLGLAALQSCYLAGLYRTEPDRKASTFWSVLSVGLLFMLLEDAGEIRHSLASYVQWVFDERIQGVMATLFELIYFAGLASLPLLAYFVFGRGVLRQCPRGHFALIIGYLCYALAGSMSFAGSAFAEILTINFYSWLGEGFYISGIIMGDSGVEPHWAAWNAAEGWNSIQFYLMDSVVEESIELIGAASFAAACSEFISHKCTKKTQN